MERHITQLADEGQTSHQTMAFMTKYLDTSLAALESAYYVYKLIANPRDPTTIHLLLSSFVAHLNPFVAFYDWVYNDTTVITQHHQRRVAPIDYSVGDKLRPKVAPSPRPPSHSSVSAVEGPLLSGAAWLGLLELTRNPVQVEALTSVRTQLPCAPAPAAPPPCLSHSPSPQV